MTLESRLGQNAGHRGGGQSTECRANLFYVHKMLLQVLSIFLRQMFYGNLFYTAYFTYIKSYTKRDKAHTLGIIDGSRSLWQQKIIINLVNQTVLLH